MEYTIRNNAGKPLSGFYPNDCRKKLVFRKTDYMTFPTYTEAMSMLVHIHTYDVGHKLKVVAR